MGNFYKYNDGPAGAGVSGLTTADAGDAIADNEIIRGDGTTGIQGSTVTMDDAGTITLPAAESIEWSTDTGLARSAAGVVKVTDGGAGLGGIATKNGTKTAPALLLGNDADTGIYSPTSNGFSYAINGAPAFTIIAGGAVRIQSGGDYGFVPGSDTDGVNLDASIFRVAPGVVGIHKDSTGGLGYIQNSGGRAALGSDLTNATATMANISALTVNLFASRKYTFRMVLFVSNSTAGEGVKIDFDGGTATATDFRAHARIYDTALLLSAQTTALATDIAQATITGASVIEVDGSFTVNAAGTFIPRIAENTTATGTLTVETGSHLWVEDTPFI